MDNTYTEGIAGDGAAILKDGVQMTISEILETLNTLQEKADLWDSVENKIKEKSPAVHKILKTFLNTK